MKKLQKLFAIMMAVCMVMAFGVSAMADTVYLCGKEEHTHDGASCVEHIHDDACTGLICGKEAGAIECTAAHTHDGVGCGCAITEEGHEHSNACCAITEHTHDATCPVHVHSEACNGITCTKTCELEEHTHDASCKAVASIGSGETVSYYGNIADAVKAANESSEEGTITIVLIENSEFNKQSTVNRDITIDGQDYVLLRAENYTGTLFVVAKDAILNLEDVVIDGNNDWVLDEEAYKDDVNSGEKVPNGTTGKYVTYEEGAPIATDVLIKVNDGTLVLDGVTIQDSASKATMFNIANGSEVILTDTVIDHNTKTGGSIVAHVSAGGKLTINEGTEIKDNHDQNGNATIARVEGSAVINEGSKIYDNTGVDCNGSVMMLYGSKASLVMNGGEIYNNGSLQGTYNGWNPVFYVYGNGATFTMNGGEIHDNYGTIAPGVVSNGDKASVTLNGGNIRDNISTSGKLGADVYILCDGLLTKDMEITGSHFYNDFTNTSTLTGNIWFDGYYKGLEGDVGPFDSNTYTGSGTVVGNVTVYNGSDTDMLNGEWLDGMVTVNAIGKDSTLTVKNGATIDGIQVRVLDSVASGDSENSSEAQAAQAASYVEEDGANVKSPVLYYHRLTSKQQSDLVITYDYNGGLDAQNWSGIQRTGEGEEYDLSNMPTPTRAGYKLAGWKYAEVDDPESLSMDGTSDYQEGDVATKSLRLIAVWEKLPDNNNNDNNNDFPYIPGNNNFGDNTFGDPEITPDVEINENDVPLTDGEIIEDNEIPLVGLPNTGSTSATLTYVFLAGAAMCAIALIVLRKRAK